MFVPYQSTYKKKIFFVINFVPYLSTELRECVNYHYDWSIEQYCFLHCPENFIKNMYTH